MLCSICISYYHNDETFDIIGDNVNYPKLKNVLSKSIRMVLSMQILELTKILNINISGIYRSTN